MNKWGIKTRVLFLAVAPVILVSGVLTYYMVTTRLADTEVLLQQRGEAIVRHLVPASEYALYSLNKELLQNLADSATEEKDVLLVTIKDKSNNIVVKAYPLQSKVNGLPSSKAYEVFSTPVYASGIDVFDFESEFSEDASTTAQAEVPLLGFVEVVVSRLSTQEQQIKIISNTVGLSVAGVLLSVLLAMRIGTGVTTPIIRLTKMEDKLLNNDYSVRVPEESGGELGVLEKGFNLMTQSLQESHAVMTKEIETATEKLRDTVKELESKNHQLDEARQHALQASQSKADFLAKMSHEIRTPMNAVIGFTNLLKKTEQAPEQLEYTRTISQAALQLLTVIDDVLNFSKLESGTVELESTLFDVRGCMEDVISMLSPAAHEKGLELVLLIHSDVPNQIVSDPARMTQVLTNLANNAIKFTQSGGVTVQVGTQINEEQNALLKVSVQDTGIGINETDIPKLFSEFSQADFSITRQFGGTGLGLTIAKRLVELMGGEISVDSELGQGSTFTYVIPYKEQTDIEIEALQSSLKDIKVLIFDPHSFSRRAIRNNLILWGAQVFAARSAAQFFPMIQRSQEAQQSPYDLIIRGCSIEELEVEALAHCLANIRDNYNGPLLLLVSREELQVPEHVQQDANLQWITKPARRETLYRNICSLLNIRQISSSREDYSKNQKSESDRSGDFLDKKILLCEDNDFNRLLISKLLTEKGIDVTETTDGQEAFDCFQAESFDLILMDIHLPKVDGIEATKQIRNMEQQQKSDFIPIIALTADVFADDDNQLVEAGFSDYLLKPVVEMKFWRMLGKYLIQTRSNKNIFNKDADLGGKYDDAPDQKLNINPTANLEAKLIEELQKQLKNLNVALQDQDTQELFNGAHQVKGLAGYFGKTEIVQLAKQLESCAESADFKKAELVVKALEEKLEL